MNFKTAQYNSLIDVEIIVLVQEAKLRMLKAKLKNDMINRDKFLIDEDLVKINSTNECLSIIKELKEDMITLINKLYDGTGNLEGQIFIDKICKGLPSNEILKKYNIAEITLRKYYCKIRRRLEATPYGKKLDAILTDDYTKNIG